MDREFLLFDHDGVLVDTERWYYAATRDTLAGLGIDLDEALHLEMMAEGRPAWELARASGIDEATIDASRDARNALYQRHLREQDVEIPGVAHVLAELGRRYRMALVTTSRRVDLELIHAGGTLLGHFEQVVTVEDVSHAKPHPDPYRTGLRRLGATPERALAVEDSSRGLRSALAASLDCVIVRHAFTAEMDFSGAHRVLDSLSELPALLSGS